MNKKLLLLFLFFANFTRAFVLINLTDYPILSLELKISWDDPSYKQEDEDPGLKLAFQTLYPNRDFKNPEFRITGSLYPILESKRGKKITWSNGFKETGYINRMPKETMLEKNIVFAFHNPDRVFPHCTDLDVSEYSLEELKSPEIIFIIKNENNKISIAKTNRKEIDEESRDLIYKDYEDNDYIKEIFNLVRDGSPEIIKLLKNIKNKNKNFWYLLINYEDEEGFTLLMRACQGHKIPEIEIIKKRVVMLLLKNGADKNIMHSELEQRGKKMTARDFAILSGYFPEQ